MKPEDKKDILGKISKKNDTNLVKKITLIILVGTILNLSINKGIIMLQATFLYASTGAFWYEVLNYCALSLAVIILPPLALFFLESEHVRRLLRLYLLIVVLFNLFEIAATFNGWEYLWTFERSYNVIYILIETFSATFCWILPLRQIAGHSFLPIPIKTNMYSSYTITELYIINPIRNLIDFIRKPLMVNRKRVNIAVIVNIILFSGILLSFIPENSIMTIKRPRDHQMRISLWGGQELNNSTLDILGAHNSRCFIWGDYMDEAKWSRFKDRNVDVLIVQGFQSEEAKWTVDMANVETMMNLLDTQNHTGVVGFTDDMEMLTNVIQFNQTYYEKYVNFIQNKTNYVRSRGYEYHITQWLTAINDYRDGDTDMGVVYQNPFDPVKFANLSSIGWMIYRSELAIKYDEPYSYFTHQWATQIYSYMDFLEKENNIPTGFWKNKTTMSIGVADDSSLYTFNVDLNPKARENFMQELKICQANRISEVIIFIAGETDSTGKGKDGFLEVIGGDAGLTQMFDEIENYEEVQIVYKRRATFFGNLKILSNLPGSVFGLIYSDVLYDFLTGFLVYLWGAVYILAGYMIIKHPFPQQISEQNERKFDGKTCVIRSIFVGVLVLFFFMVYFALRFPEFWIIMDNITYFLKFI